MLADISNYRPEEIDFVLDDAELEKYPRVIFEGAKSIEEILKIVNDKFIPIFPEKEVCLRNLDDFEKNNIREEYCHIEENELPAAIKEQSYKKGHPCFHKVRQGGAETCIRVRRLCGCDWRNPQGRA